MLERLRWRLTGLYLLIALLLVVSVSLAAYFLVQDRLLSEVDRSLGQKMALGFVTMQAPVPAALESAWQTYQAQQATGQLLKEAEEDDDDHSNSESDDYRSLLRLDLTATFLIAADTQGKRVDLKGASEDIPVNLAALQAAAAQGFDRRTVLSADGSRVRLLSYALDARQGIVLQTGRSIAAEDQLLQRLVLSLLALSLISVSGLGWAGWWLAGRSIQPARQAWERQQSFIANASHELRAPLTLLRAGVEVARRRLPADAEEPRRLLDDALGEVDSMNRLVSDLLLLSRLDSEGLGFQIQALPVAEFLQTLEQRVQNLAQEKGLQLRFVAPSGPAAGARIAADPQRLQQALLILLDNAFRYTPAGGMVEVNASLNGKQALLTVQDNGSGIAAEHLLRIFDRFYRVDEARGRDSGGAGLGLAIARSLVEAQHGQISLESKPGQGTRVIISLPTA